MGKYFIFDEAAGLVIPETHHSLYSARDKAETMAKNAAPGQRPQLLVCEAHCRVEIAVEVRAETDHYPVGLFGLQDSEGVAASVPVRDLETSEEAF